MNLVENLKEINYRFHKNHIFAVLGGRAQGAPPGSAPVMHRNGVITDRNGDKMNRNGAIINRN
jgi:hypothetical protein